MSNQYVELLSVYSEETKAVLERIREELNEDVIFSRMEADYNVYDLLAFNEFNIQERLERLSFHMKDMRLKYLQELSKLEQVKDRLEKVTGEKYIALKNGEVSLTKTEIEKYYLPKDEELMNLKALYRKQELRAKYFEAVHQSMDKLTWHIKMYMENGRGGY